MPQNITLQPKHEVKTHEVKYGETKRKSFSKIKEILEMPYLLQSQIDSYKQFITTGIQDVLDDFSPVEDRMGRFKLYYLGFALDENPPFSIKQCKDGDRSYTTPLRVKVRIVREETAEMMEEEAFMGEIPLITDNGSFIINGTERVVVSQLVRSPSVYNTSEKDKTGTERYATQIMPQRGAWVEFKQDQNDIVWVSVDRKRKFPATILMRSLLPEGTNDELIKIFGDEEILKKTFEKDTTDNSADAKREFYKRQSPGETPTEDGIKNLISGLFFEPRKYDLMRVGRYKINKKLSIATRIDGATLAADVVDANGEVLASSGEVVDGVLADKIQNSGINEVTLVAQDGGTCKIIGNNTVDMKAYAKNYIKSLAKVVPEDLGINEKVYLPALLKLVEENPVKEDLIEAIKANVDMLIVKNLTLEDIIASFNMNLSLVRGFGTTDNIDHLANRRVRCVGELLQQQFRIGLAKLDRNIKENMSRTQDDTEFKIHTFLNPKPVAATIKEFFCSSPLSQFMDHHNPAAELTNKRKLSALGPGGLNRERAGFEVRDINHTHYGRLCPIETPEGQNIGLISSLASYAKINEYGFIEAPYRKVDKEKGIVTEEVRYLQADEEDQYIVAQANTPLNEDGSFKDSRVMCRIKDDIRDIDSRKVDYMDVSPKQLISVASALIPFLENDDTARALMGSNMQRQAVPLLRPEAPMIATGIEHKIAYDSGVMVIAKHDGVVKSVSADQIVVTTKGEDDVYVLQKFERSNAGTCINQKPIVGKGQKILKGMVIADGPATQNGELALGRNILIGYMSWEGYNYEDAILINEDLVKNDVFTSIHIEKFEISARDTKLGAEQITRDIPNLGEEALKNLDENGIIRIGSEVGPRDILVGETRPKGETDQTPEERLLKAIFGDKGKEVKDSSLRLPHGQYGVVIDVKVFTKEHKDELAPGVNKLVRVFVAQKRKIGVGDKMSGRHGNKGVISRVLPREDMPFLADGTRLQIVLNPLGVPSRMNIGQVLEVHLGYIAKKLGWMIETPVFDGATEADIKELLIENNLPRDGKFTVYDGRTGEAFENPVTVGYMYMLKLCHLVDEKMHARSTGRYALITQQPLGGKAQFGGQRFGEMEVWALEAYGAAHILQEVLTIKSDDIMGRQKSFEAIVNGKPITEPGTPESFKVLIKEFQALGLDIKVLNDKNEEVGIKDYSDMDTFGSRKHDRDSYSTDDQKQEIDITSGIGDTSIEDDLSFKNLGLSDSTYDNASSLISTADDDDEDTSFSFDFGHDDEDK